MKNSISKYRFLAFYLLAVAIVALVMSIRSATDSAELLPELFAFLKSRGLYANTLSIGLFATQDWRALLIFVFAAAPSISAAVICGISGGREGMLRLFSRLRPWSGVAARQGQVVYLVLASLYLAGVGFYLLFAHLRGGDGALKQILAGLGGSWGTAALWLGVGPFIDEGGLWEELGWHGFALPVLLDRLRSPMTATLLLGFLWWLWHFPREIPNIIASSDLGTWAFYQALFLVLCLALSIVTTLAWFKTGGSALPAVLIHGFTNVWSKALSGPVYAETGHDVRTWLVIAVAVFVALVTRGRLGAPRDTRTWPVEV